MRSCLTSVKRGKRKTPDSGKSRVDLPSLMRLDPNREAFASRGYDELPCFGAE